MATISRPSRRVDGARCGTNLVMFGGKERKVPGGIVKTGLFFKRLLWHAACDLELTGPERLERFGLSANSLDSYKNSPKGNMRQQNVIIVCIRTNMLAADLAHPDDEWPAAIDKFLLEKLGFKPDFASSLANQFGDSWNAVRAKALADVESGRSNSLTPGLADPLVSGILDMVSRNELGRKKDIDVMSLVRHFDARPSQILSALQQLVHRGIISSREIGPGVVSYRVAAITAQHGREMMLVRSILEPALVEQVLGDASAKNFMIGELKRSNYGMREALERDDSPLFIDYDIDFHASVASDKPFVSELLRHLMRVIHTAVPGMKARTAHQRGVLSEHKAIVAAIEAGDADAPSLLREHILKASHAVFSKPAKLKLKPKTKVKSPA